MKRVRESAQLGARTFHLVQSGGKEQRKPPMPAENQPGSRSDRNRNTGTWLVLTAALLCLGLTGCHSYRALPDAAPKETSGTKPAQRDVATIADESLSARLADAPDLGAK